jgi:AraC-like DNA-binding protein
MTTIETPDLLTETPPLREDHRVELLADVFSHIRLSGALFMRGEYTAPWGFDSPEADELVAMLSPGAERLIVFHSIRSGVAWVTAGGQRVELAAGDVVLLPHAHRHVLSSPGANSVVPINEVFPPEPWTTVPVCRYGGGGELTEVACGYLRCEELLFNPFLSVLPPVFRVRPEGVAAEMLRAAVNYLIDEPASAGGWQAVLMSRLPELLLVEALRLYSETNAPAGWLAATGDPVVSRALKLLHEDPANDWSVEDLARAAATSRSVLNERFRVLLGQSPMRYLLHWRMQLAADLLRTTGLKIADIAERSGYGSDVAFSRAFQRHVGASPAQWRGNV